MRTPQNEEKFCFDAKICCDVKQTFFDPTYKKDFLLQKNSAKNNYNWDFGNGLIMYFLSFNCKKLSVFVMSLKNMKLNSANFGYFTAKFSPLSGNPAPVG